MAESPNERLAQLEARYQHRFAGHPRISRDPELLEGMLGEARKLRANANATDDADFIEKVDSTVDRYQAELEQIRTVQAMPGVVQQARLRMWAELAQSRYRRHFSGQNRSTRDPQLLTEIHADVRQWRGEMEVLNQRVPTGLLRESIDMATKNLLLFQGELDQIRVHRASGTLAEQASRLAKLANEQLNAYRTFFAGQSRISRRTAHLERMLQAITELRDQMRKLTDRGHRHEANARSIALLTERIGQWRDECGAIRKAHRDVDLEQRVGALGQQANVFFAEYRDHFAGQARTTRELDRLTTLLEGLWQVAREMDDLDRTDGDDGNERNLRLVIDNLRRYTREWDAIRQAQSSDA